MRGSVNRAARGRVRVALSVAVAACAVTAVLPGAATAGTDADANVGAGVERISVADDGTQGAGGSTGASITPDGSRIVYASTSSVLVPGGSTNKRVYVRDQRSRHTMRMPNSYPPLGPPVISGDGQYTVHWAWLFKDTKSILDLVDRDAWGGVACGGLTCSEPSINADGRYIAQVSEGGGRPVTWANVEVVDQRGGTEMIAEGQPGQFARPSISDDGQYVAYEDREAHDVWLWNSTDGTTSDPIEGQGKEATLVQLSGNGNKVGYRSGADTHVYDVAADTDQVVPNTRGLAIDPSGRYLLYAPGDTTGPAPLKLRDLRTGTDEVVSDQPATAEPDAISAGGRDVVFQSAADGIVPGDTNAVNDIFVRHFF